MPRTNKTDSQNDSVQTISSAQPDISESRRSDSLLDLQKNDLRRNGDDTDSVAAKDADARDDTGSQRRKRGGRRVVRGAGAAGAAVRLQVEDHPVLFEEPDTSVASAAQPDASEPSKHAKSADGGKRHASKSAGASRRRHTAHANHGNEHESQDTESRNNDVTAGETGPEAINRQPAVHTAAHGSRPMTSLLFQEPILPAAESIDGEQDRELHGELDELHGDDAQEREASHSPRRTRARRARVSRDDGDRNRGRHDKADIHDREEDDVERDGAHIGGDHGDETFTEPDERPLRVRRRGGARHQDDAGDGYESEGGSHSRRLNAQERRAAGEVERIEEDLADDDITYAPIRDEETPDQPTRTRRRRRSRIERIESHEDTEHESHDRGGSDDGTSLHRHRQDDDEGTTLTRRRRRRRSQHGSEDQDEQPRRSRKQQYIDEITDIAGSTRLEAKKQRRRDNRRERSRQSQLIEQDFLARREHVDRLMVVRERERHTQISVIEDNILVEHYVSDIQEVATVGNIYLGRVQNVLPSMEAAFVDIGQPRNGVLYAGEVNWDSTRLEGQPRRIELAFKSGDPVLVQVTKDPIGHKGARLTSQVTLAGRFLVLVPSGGMTGVSRKLSEHERTRLKSIVSKIAPKDMGIIIRTAADGASDEAIAKDLENLMHQWDRIVAKREEFRHGKRPKLLQGEPDVAIRVVRDIFNDDFSKLIVEGGKVYDRIEEYLDSMAPDLRDKLERWDPADHEGKDVFDRWQIDSQLRKGMERQVYLPSGGSIVIDRTEAMTTVDVNTGRFIGRGKSLEETVTRCNLEAAEEIARQLRLRDIGGMVMIDFVDMVLPANRDLVLRRLVECLARDRTKHQVAEVTSLGLVQMTRKRIGQGLVEAFSEECPTCKGRGFIVHDEPTVSADYDDPYAMRGGDPFVKTNKHGHGAVEVSAPKGSSPDVKAKLAQIAAAAVAANDSGEDESN